MSDLEVREFDVRATDNSSREVSGIAVPYGQVTTVGNYREQFAPDSAVPAPDAMLFWRHSEPIGKIVGHEQTADGLVIRAYISETPRGNEAYTLLRDGVITKFSVGFEPIEQRIEEDGTVTRTSTLVREVSLVPMPAYAGATITEVRESVTLTKEEESMSEIIDTPAAAELAEVRGVVEMLERKIENLSTVAVAAVVKEQRSAGEILHAIAAGDESALRAYTGATTGDSVLRDAWVGDLTRIVDEAAPLRAVFASQALPADGNFVEYASLTTNTVVVDEQAAEGDDLTYGEVVIDSHTAAINTFGGYSELSRQSIERSSVNYLSHVLMAQAAAAGKAINTAIRTQYAAEVGAQVTATNTVTLGAASFAAATYQNWISAAIDAQIKFQAQGLSMDALVVDAATFKSLLNVESADGRPVFLVTGSGTNNVGSLSVRGLAGDLASIPVIVDAGLSGQIAFVNRNALTFFGSSVARLQDENIVNLTKSFSVYMYGAVASTIPSAIIPVVI
tara:strand:- start:1306 stop:2823 length:1518 start_codon:yes stop_codon:yes gene_type:complete